MATKKKRDPLQGSMIVLHGPPKVGKTQLVSKFPGPVKFFATEPGHKFIPKEQKEILTRISPNKEGWEQFLLAIDDIPRSKAKTVAIDVISGLYDVCLLHTCAKNDWEHPQDGAHGKGWHAVKMEFFRGIQQLAYACEKTKATLVMIDHSKEELVETRTSKIIKITCAMSGQARSVILPVPDHIWFLGYDHNKDVKGALKVKAEARCLYVEGSAQVEAGCRDPRVKTKSISPLSLTDPYSQILKGLYKK